MGAIQKINGMLRWNEQLDLYLEGDDGRLWRLDLKGFAEQLVDERLHDRITVEGVRLGDNWLAVHCMESDGEGPLALRSLWAK